MCVDADKCEVATLSLNSIAFLFVFCGIWNDWHCAPIFDVLDAKLCLFCDKIRTASDFSPLKKKKQEEK